MQKNTNSKLLEFLAELIGVIMKKNPGTLESSVQTVISKIKISL